MKTLLILTTILVVLTVACGVVFIKTGISKKGAKRVITSSVSAFALVLIATLVFILSGHASMAAETAAVASTSGLKFIGAGLSTGLAAIGSGYAVASTGAAGIGAISEEPSLFGRTILYVGLAEGIAIYGLIISILILA